jgi:hypothetical protein
MKKHLIAATLTALVAVTTATAETLPLCKHRFCESLENIQGICAARQEALVPLVVDPQTSCMCDCAAIWEQTVTDTDSLSFIGRQRTVKVLPHIQVQASEGYFFYGKVTKPYNYVAPAGWVIIEADLEVTYQNGENAGVSFTEKHQHGFDLLSLDEINRAYDVAINYLHQQGLKKYWQHRLTRQLEEKRNAHHQALFKANIGFSAVDYAAYAQGAGYYRSEPATLKGYLKVTEQYVGNDFATLKAALKHYVDQEVALLQQY